MAMLMDWRASASWPLWVAGIVLFQFVVSRASTHSRTLSVAHFPLRSALHLQRKAQHALTGLLFYIAAGTLAPDLAVTVLLGAAGGFYIVHELRKRSPRVDKLYLASFRGILRQDEAAKRVLPGAFYFVLGSALTLALFPLSIARLAVVHLSVGDPAASLVGTLFRQRFAPHSAHKPVAGARGTKSWAGFVGAFVASALASAAVLGFGDPGNRGDTVDRTALVPKALLAGLAAATAECADIRGWDDNLTLPLLAALLLQLNGHMLGFEY